MASLLVLLLAVRSSFADPANAWQLGIVEDSVTVEPMAVLSQDSTTTIKDESAKNDVTPTLEFRCVPNESNVIAQINWQRFISSFSTEAGFKIDGGRFTWLKWKVDQSEKVTLSPSTEDSQKLIDMLSDGQELQVEITPYSEGPVIASFVLGGLVAQLEKLRAECL